MLLDVIDKELETSKLKKIDGMAARVFDRVCSSPISYWESEVVGRCAGGLKTRHYWSSEKPRRSRNQKGSMLMIPCMDACFVRCFMCRCRCLYVSHGRFDAHFMLGRGVFWLSQCWEKVDDKINISKNVVHFGSTIFRYELKRVSHADV